MISNLKIQNRYQWILVLLAAACMLLAAYEPPLHQKDDKQTGYVLLTMDHRLLLVTLRCGGGPMTDVVHHYVSLHELLTDRQYRLQYTLLCDCLLFVEAIY